MYAKQLMRGQVLFFRYAPPLTQLDVRVDESDRPTKPHKDAKLYECSVYYFWWAYLRENADYIACCENGGTGALAELYHDFGDVRGDNFMRWWRSGARELFCEPPKGEIKFFIEPPVTHDNENRLLLSLPMTGDLELTIKELRAKLKPIYARERQRLRDAARASGELEGAKKSASLARYPVHAKPVLTSLYSCLRVMQIKLADQDMDPHEIAEEAGFLNMISGREDDPSLVKRRVRQYEHKAANLIANVAEGRFPDFSPHQNARDAKGELINAAAATGATASGNERQSSLLDGGT
jgi:hypothetical protein